MAHSTGLLFLQLSSITGSNMLSKILSAAIQKVEKTLYIQASPPTDGKLPYYNQLVNQLYFSSCKLSLDRLDTRVLLSDFRDSLLGLNPADSHQNPLETCHNKVEKILTWNHGRALPSYLVNKTKSVENEVLVLGNIEEDDSTSGLGVSPTGFIASEIPNLAPEDKMYKHVVLGGTFDRLHVGHKILLSAAVLRCQESLTIGVTDGTMIQTKKLWELIEPCQTRIEKLKEFLMDVEPRLEYRIVPITDPYGPTAYDPDLQLIVVSEETLRGGHKVNQLRKEKDLSILDIHPISLIDDAQATAGEELKISSSSLRRRLLGTHLKPPKEKVKPFVIGLTGGIASGKTTICNRLKGLGARVISCDHLGHAAYQKGTKCHSDMVEHFGPSILNADGEIDRKKLGPIVFSDKAQMTKLNSMVWPEIRRLYSEEMDKMKKDEGFDGIIILDAAILLEAGWDADCHDVWVSIVPPSEAIKRITERDNLTTEQAESRVKAQLSNIERVSKANVVLCSLWEPEVTAAQVLKAWQYVHSFIAA